MIKVLHLSTHNENCGIGKYQEMFLADMQATGNIDNKFFDISPNRLKVMHGAEYENAFRQLKGELRNFDILHIQHEFSFYWQDELERAVQIARKLRKKVIVTLHTSPTVAYREPKLGGLGPRSFVAYARDARIKRKVQHRLIEPLKTADRILVHNEVTKKALTDLGVPEAIIGKIVIPIPAVDFAQKSTRIRDGLNAKPGDIVYCTVGFLHRFKGLYAAVKALSYLPENYKLAVIGGLHPGTDDIEIYDKLADLIEERGLKERVHITGYIENDEVLNACIRECDVSVYPYDKVYYSNVSSAALNNSLANYVPVIAYPTESFKEVNSLQPVLTLTQSFSYYELARELKNIDLKAAAKAAEDYANKYSYKLVTIDLEAYYAQLCL